MYAVDAKMAAEMDSALVVRRGIHIFVKIHAPVEFNPNVLHGARAKLLRNDMYGRAELSGILVRAVSPERLVLFTRRRRLIQVHRQSVAPASTKSREFIFRFATPVPNIDPACIEFVVLEWPKGSERAISNAAFKPGE